MREHPNFCYKKIGLYIIGEEMIHTYRLNMMNDEIYDFESGQDLDQFLLNLHTGMYKIIKKNGGDVITLSRDNIKNIFEITKTVKTGINLQSA